MNTRYNFFYGMNQLFYYILGWFFVFFYMQAYSRVIDLEPSIEQKNEVTWFFSPGIHTIGLDLLSKFNGGAAGSESLAINFVPGGYVTTDRNIAVIGPKVTCAVYNEIMPVSFSFKKILPFLYEKITRKKTQEINKRRRVVFNGCNYIVNLDGINFGQENDIATLVSCFNIHQKKFSCGPIILYGVSRGAACAFNACSTGALDVSRLKGIVLEGCFDHIEHVIARGKVNMPFNLSLILKRFFKTIYQGYNPNGPHPICVADGFPRDIPTLFITSKKDRVVPMACTLNLFNTLKQRGYTNTYLLVLQHSPHAEYIFHPEDRAVYERVIHAFYKICGLPIFDAILAEEGMQILDEQNGLISLN